MAVCPTPMFCGASTNVVVPIAPSPPGLSDPPELVREFRIVAAVMFIAPGAPARAAISPALSAVSHTVNSSIWPW